MRLVFLGLLVISLIASLVIGFSRSSDVHIELPGIFRTKAAVAPLPVLQQRDSFPLLSAQGVLAVDVESGVVLYEKDADKPLLPASTTKIVTALTALDHYQLDEVIAVEDPTVVGQKMGLVVGEQITFDNLLKALLIYSANDAAEVLARQYPEGREAFILEMNEKAQELAMYDTVFTNPSGLDDIGHLSTARNLTRAALIAMDNPLVREIVNTKETVVESIDGRFIHPLNNTNELLGEVEGVVGIKTGWTENARENLVTVVERDDREIIIALLGSQDRFGETEELIEWMYGNYIWEDVEVPVYSTP
jgi:D-alanyl-D-alanine carboxypeptidase